MAGNYHLTLGALHGTNKFSVQFSLDTSRLVLTMNQKLNTLSHAHSASLPQIFGFSQVHHDLAA